MLTASVRDVGCVEQQWCWGGGVHHPIVKFYQLRLQIQCWFQIKCLELLKHSVSSSVLHKETRMSGTNASRDLRPRQPVRRQCCCKENKSYDCIFSFGAHWGVCVSGDPEESVWEERRRQLAGITEQMTDGKAIPAESFEMRRLSMHVWRRN